MNEVNINYPGLFLISDKKSQSSQKLFVRLNKYALYLLVLSAIWSSYQFNNTNINLIASLLIISSLSLIVILLIIKPEKGWYDGRAIAESIKSLCWKYMSKSSPFGEELNQYIAEDRLIKNFKKIIGQKKDFFSLIGGEFAKFEQVTNTLKEIRNINLETMIKIYTNKRLEEQKEWYRNKANSNKVNKNKTFGLIIVFHVIALISLFVNYFYDLPILLSPFFACISSALIAWLQLKRYQELTQSYSITATELSMIKSKVHQIKNQQDFSRFVDDAESAISREHTLWLARRDSVELFS